jgi:glucose-1-phosphate thymidylyltransferase
MKGIILHGGHGTRLRPLTHTGPKQLLPIANKPMSEYCIESIRETGITEIAIIIGGLGANKVKEYYGTGEKFGIKITYVEQDEPKGIAHAINLCKDFINNEKFLVFLGDNIIQRSIYDYVENFKKSNFDATLLLCEVDNPSSFGIAQVENKKIIKITEKPKKPLSNLAVTGIYLLTPKIFSIIENLEPSWRNELEITDALDILLNQNNNLSFEIITDYWKDTGTPQDIIHANGEIIKNIPEYFLGEKSENTKIFGKVLTGKNSIIDKNVTIKGPVIIGENCKINSGVIIGPNTSIGNNSIINQGDIENSIIMGNCEIDCNVKIRNSIISTNSKIIQSDKINDEKIFLLGEGTKIYL